METIDNEELITASIKLEKTAFGFLISLLYKPNPIYINITLASGVVKSFRLLSDLSDHDFLFSPLIETTTDFLSLYKNKESLAKNKVSSFMIFTKKNDWCWNNKIHATLTGVHP